MRLMDEQDCSHFRFTEDILCFLTILCSEAILGLGRLTRLLFEISDTIYLTMSRSERSAIFINFIIIIIIQITLIFIIKPEILLEHTKSKIFWTQ